jgi:hypothetical protein
MVLLRDQEAQLRARVAEEEVQLQFLRQQIKDKSTAALQLMSAGTNRTHVDMFPNSEQQQPHVFYYTQVAPSPSTSADSGFTQTSSSAPSSDQQQPLSFSNNQVAPSVSLSYSCSTPSPSSSSSLSSDSLPGTETADVDASVCGGKVKFTLGVNNNILWENVTAEELDSYVNAIIEAGYQTGVETETANQTGVETETANQTGVETETANQTGVETWDVLAEAVAETGMQQFLPAADSSSTAAEDAEQSSVAAMVAATKLAGPPFICSLCQAEFLAKRLQKPPVQYSNIKAFNAHVGEKHPSTAHPQVRCTARRNSGTGDVQLCGRILSSPKIAESHFRRVHQLRKCPTTGCDKLIAISDEAHHLKSVHGKSRCLCKNSKRKLQSIKHKCKLRK